MGDQVGQTTEGTLYFIPYAEFERVRGLGAREARAAMFADMCRLNVLYMIARAGSGHIGSSFSSLDIVSWLLLEELKPATTWDASGDIYFSSKGHDAPGYYAALIGLGCLPFDLIHRLRRIDGLPGHPDVSTAGIVTNTGSLGMGISKAKGMVFANRLGKRKGRIFVMTGDGELQEGQFWESLLSAGNHGLHEIVVIVDHNKLQSDSFVRNVSDLGDLEAKLRDFGWRVERCDGHDVGALAATLASLGGEERPKIIVADTIKGRGVTFMEHTALDSDVAMYRFHSGAPDSSSYMRAAREIVARINSRLAAFGVGALQLESTRRESVTASAGTPQRMIPAYTRVLLEQAERHDNLVALDADLVLDTGLIPFRERFPERFFECGIAEQDMVSMAGGMALKGLLPVVHSFSCFLSARPNEQIYNNATEGTRIIYVGSLAGVVPGGPGHSHQAVRDISVLAAIPDLVVMEPCCEAEVAMLFDWCVNQAAGSCYLRLTSVPWHVPISLPDDYSVQIGCGAILAEGRDAAVIAYGPVLVSLAMQVAQRLHDESRIDVRVICVPWLNYIDGAWMSRALAGCEQIFSLDNHYVIGGQGSHIADHLAQGLMPGARLYRMGIEHFPKCGTNAEVLSAHGLDVDSIAAKIHAVVDG